MNLGETHACPWNRMVQVLRDPKSLFLYFGIYDCKPDSHKEHKSYMITLFDAYIVGFNNPWLLDCIDNLIFRYYS